jgi:uncharacterized protein YecE (DUF72 family)
MDGLYVGTSGWVYKHWAGTFYPKGTGARRHLPYYAGHFNTVELNATFYRLPTLSASQGWHDAVPPGFVFAVKGSRFITHMKKLEVEPSSIAIFFERIAPLADRRGPLLWQLPPQLARDLPRLERFLGALPKGLRHAFEFRHPSWYDDERVFDVLRGHGAAHVSISSQGMPRRFDVTADFAYFRFHGLEGGVAHDYTRAELRPWAAHARSCLERGIEVFAYFNNDMNTRAPANAVTMRAMVTGPSAAGPRPAYDRLPPSYRRPTRTRRRSPGARP